MGEPQEILHAQSVISTFVAMADNEKLQARAYAKERLERERAMNEETEKASVAALSEFGGIQRTEFGQDQKIILYRRYEQCHIMSVALRHAAAAKNRMKNMFLYIAVIADALLVVNGSIDGILRENNMSYSWMSALIAGIAVLVILASDKLGLSEKARDLKNKSDGYSRLGMEIDMAVESLSDMSPKAFLDRTTIRLAELNDKTPVISTDYIKLGEESYHRLLTNKMKNKERFSEKAADILTSEV